MKKQTGNRQSQSSNLWSEIAARRARVQPNEAPFDFHLHGHRWCIARAEVRDGRISKVPVNLYGRPLDVTKAGAGTLDLGKVIAQFKSDSQAIGIGFILTGNDIVVLDVDHCLTPDGWHPAVVELVHESRSYAEISSGGDGAHLFLTAPGASGRYQNRKCLIKDLQIERYSHSRFIACTFNRFPNAGEFVERNGEFLSRIDALMGSPKHLKGFPRNGVVISDKSPLYQGPTSPEMSDEQVLDRCRSAKNAQKFNTLFELGDATVYHDGDLSRADQSLLQTLSFFTQNPAQLERLFSRSALGLRDKWTRRIDYRFSSIVTALLKHGVVQ